LLYRNTFQNHCQDKNDGISVKYFSHFSLADKQTEYIFTNSSLTNNYEYLYLDVMWISIKEINIKRPICTIYKLRNILSKIKHKKEKNVKLKRIGFLKIQFFVIATTHSKNFN